MNKLIWEVFEIVLYIVEYFIFYDMLKQHLRKRREVKWYNAGIYILLVTICGSVLKRSFHSTIISSIVSVATFFWLGDRTFTGRKRNKLLLTVLYMVILLVIDLGIGGILISVLGVNMREGILGQTSTRVCGAVLSKFILYCFFKFVNYYYDDTLKDLPNKIWCLLFTVFISSTFSMMGIIKMSTNVNLGDGYGNFMTILAVGIFLCNITMYVTMTQYNLYVRERKDYELIEYQNDILIKATLEKDDFNKEVRKMWHDFNNHISCVDMLLQMGNIERARDYIHDMNASCAQMYMGIKTGNEISDSVINQKCRIAQNHHIKMTVAGVLGENLPINQVDLCALLSNSLDNAIEASLKIEDETAREIHLNLNLYKDYLIIEVRNTVKEQVNVEKGLVTTKKDKSKHGIGMLSMKTIVEKYNGHIDWICEDYLFTVSMMLRLINKNEK